MMTASDTPALQANERGLDRVIRAVVGAAMLTFAIITFTGPFAVVEGIIALALGIGGAISLGTGLLGWCPFYAMLGVSTCEARVRRAQAGR
jgi:Inner membrane protein YgaP-like, transmembrane domain